MNAAVRKLQDGGEKARIAEAVLAALPEWFGMPEYTREYVRTSAKLPVWAAFVDEKPVGFAAWKQISPYTVEVYVMGVLPRYHRHGIGKALVSALEEAARGDGFEFLQVKTVAAGHYAEYDRTRLFYEAMGFRALEVFPTLWDEWNLCLVMVKHLEKDND